MLAVVAFAFQPSQAQAAITYVASASNPSDNNTLDQTTVAVTPPASMLVGDLVIMVAIAREAGNTLAISETGGQTWTSETANTTNTSQRIFWARYNGTWSANPSVSFPSSANGTTVAMHVFRPSSTAMAWAVDVAIANTSYSTPSWPYDVTISGITTATDGALVFATWASTDNNTWSLQTAGWSNAGNAQYRNGDGSDNSQSSAYKIMATAGATGNVVNRQATNGGDAGNKSIIAFKEVLLAPTVTKTFNSSSIVIGGTSTLSVTLANSNSAAITGLAFSDAYPSGLVNATTLALSNTCGGTASAAAGGSSLTLSGATLAGGASCTVSVNVTSSAAGSHANSTGTVTSTNAATGTAASATLTVTYAPATCGSGAIASGIVNTYYPGSASVSAGATSITVGTSSGDSTAIAANDMLLVIQMQDQNITTSNNSSYGTVSGTPTAGQYEYVLAAGPVSGGVVTLSSALANGYTASAYGSNGQKTFQVIRVPAYSSATLPTSGLTAQAWNGSTGGVLALDVKGALNLNGATVDVSGKGFRGGGGCRWVGSTTGGVSSSDYRRTASTTCPSTSQGSGRANGLKGEGIAGTPRYVYDGSARVDTGVEGYPNGSTARGAPGNAGGGGTDDDPDNNDENTGGGGGAGYGGGGTGGYAWSNGSSPGRGLGGTGVAQSATKLTLGGGAGAGSSNDGTADGNGLDSSGVAGGGIIMIRAGSLTGTATFNAKGNDNGLPVNNDGSGGGGGGGAVLVSAGSGLAGLTINVGGGYGGTNDTNGAAAHGPGGGGGGGYALTTSAPAACTVAGGSAGLTTDTGDADANTSYGASAGNSGLCQTSSSLASSIPGTALGNGACATAVNHYAITHSGSGVTCEAEPVTFTAHDAAHSRVDAGGNTLSITAKNVTGGAATGTWVASDGSVCSTTCYDASGTAKAACGNTPTYTPSGSSTGIASYLFATGESGIKLCLKQSGAMTQNIDLSDGSASESSTEDANLAFADTGFRFYADGSVDAIGNLVAGLRSDATVAAYQPTPQTLTVRAVKSSTTTPARCTPLIGSATKTVKFAYQCIDPTSCHGASAGLEVNGVAVAGSGGTPTPASDVSVSFDASGYGSINLKYWDVGQIKLYAQAAIADAGTGGTTTIASGASNTFLVKPFGFSVVPCASLSGGVCASTPADPGTAGGGSALIKAGSPFNATIKAVAYDGTTVTPSFGLGTSNGAESAAMSFMLVAPTNVCSGGTANCPSTLGGTTSILRSAFSSGIVTVTDLTWSEVGVITLKATNATFQGTTLSPEASGTSGNLGRFYPHHFTTALTHGCAAGSFTYSSQPFDAVVTARNSLEGVTANYAGSYAHAVTLADGGTGAVPCSSNCTVASTQFSTGVATLNAASGNQPTFAFASVLTAPATLALRAAENGADGVTSSGYTEGSTAMRSGRLRLSNAFGSEKSALAMPVQAQYWSGSTWVLNGNDSCTSLPANAFALSSSLTSVNGAVTIGIPSGGNGVLNLNAPGAGVVGSVDIAANLGATAADSSCLGLPRPASVGANLPWLRSRNGTCVASTTYTADPSARATFGIYSSESRRTVHVRESF